MAFEIDNSLSWAARRLRRRVWGAAGRIRPAALSSFVQSKPNFQCAQKVAKVLSVSWLERKRCTGGRRKQTQSKPIGAAVLSAAERISAASAAISNLRSQIAEGREAAVAVSSCAPNKANCSRFWPENAGRVRKQTQSGSARTGREVRPTGGLASDGREATMIESRTVFRDLSGVTGPGGRPVRIRRVVAKGGLP